MRSFWLLSAIASALVGSPALALQSSTVLDGGATLTRGGTFYSVGKGAKIYEGDILNVLDRVQLIAPYGAFVLTKRKGLLKINLTRREGCGMRMYFSYLGPISVNARPKTCKQTSAIFESIFTGASFEAWGGFQSGLIPNSLIASGLLPSDAISFTVQDRESASVLAVSSGAINVQNEGTTVLVAAGQGNLTQKGKPPGRPIKLDEALQLKSLKFYRTPTGLKLDAEINPLNTLLVQGFQVNPQAEIKWPILGNSLNIGVRNLMGDRTRYYSYPLPARK
jgi:hypothetical protein